MNETQFQNMFDSHWAVAPAGKGLAVVACDNKTGFIIGTVAQIENAAVGWHLCNLQNAAIDEKDARAAGVDEDLERDARAVAIEQGMQAAEKSLGIKTETTPGAPIDPALKVEPLRLVDNEPTSFTPFFFCPACGYELISGRCSNCKRQVAPRYPDALVGNVNHAPSLMPDPPGADDNDQVPADGEACPACGGVFMDGYCTQKQCVNFPVDDPVHTERRKKGIPQPAEFPDAPPVHLVEPAAGNLNGPPIVSRQVWEESRTIYRSGFDSQCGATIVAAMQYLEVLHTPGEYVASQKEFAERLKTELNRLLHLVESRDARDPH